MLVNEELKKTNKSLVQVKDNFTKIGEVIKKDLDKMSETATFVSKILNMGIKGFSRGLAESIVMGKELKTTFQDLARTLLTEVLATIIEILAREAVLLAIEKAKTSEIKKQSIFRSIGSFFGFGGKASGGAVSKGQPVLVGEKGPELFVPNQTGQITQNARGTDGKGVTVNFNITTLDASGFDDLLVRSRGTLTQIINTAVNERGERNLI